MKNLLLRCLLPGATAVLVACGPTPRLDVADAARSALVVDRAQLTADGTTQVLATATLRNSAGTPLSAVPVTFTLSGSGNLVPAPAVTQADGAVVAALSSTKAEAKTLTATFERDGEQVPFGGELTLDFIAGPPDSFVFLVQPTTTKAGVPIAPAVKLEVRDKSGNRSPGAFSAVMRLVPATAGPLQGGTSTASVAGVVTFQNLVINRPQPGLVLRAEPASGAAVESVPFEVTLGELSSNTSTLTAAPDPVQADGVASTTLTATLRDTGGNPLPGVALTFAVTGTGNSLGASDGVSDSAGVVTTTLASTVAEPKTVSLTSGTVVLATQVTFVP